MKQSPLIPVADLPEGIRLALQKARSHLNAAEAVLRSGEGVMAAVHFYQGVEEYGKAKLLKDARDANTPVPARRGEPYFDHRAKFALAKALIPEHCLMLSSGAFQFGAFQFGAFDVGTFVDPERREEALYVNRSADGSAWAEAPRVDSEDLSRSANCVRQLVEDALKTWAP